MKSIKYFLVLALICVTIFSSSWDYPMRGKIILLQATGETITPDLLKESAEILSGRLTTFGLDTFYLNILEEKGQIEITIPEKRNTPEIETLLTAKGFLALYETYNREEVAAILKDNRLIELFTQDSHRIGCIEPGDMKKANDIIDSYGSLTALTLCWGINEDNSMKCLYALKINPLVVRSDFESITVQEKNIINLKFNADATKKWADATRENVGKPIAIVLDDKVISDPVVRMPIESGKCEISGDFSDKGTALFLSLVNNNPLPLTLNITK